jgi:hypothetical protein
VVLNFDDSASAPPGISKPEFLAMIVLIALGKTIVTPHWFPEVLTAGLRSSVPEVDWNFNFEIRLMLQTRREQ